MSAPKKHVPSQKDPMAPAQTAKPRGPLVLRQLPEDVSERKTDARSAQAAPSQGKKAASPIGKLTEIFTAEGASDIQRLWNTTKAADEVGPLPFGTYIARIVKGDLVKGKTHGTPGYTIEFQVVEGEYAGRRFWHHLWLTELGMPMALRDLKKLGFTSDKQLGRPVPQRIVCAVRVTLRTEDDGTQRNNVRSFDVVRIDTPETEPFAPPDLLHDGDADGTGDGS